MERYVHEKFRPSKASTVGTCFGQKVVSHEGYEITLDIWDTAGQERFAMLAPMYYRGAHCAILVYDRSQPQTLTRAKKWTIELKNQSACPTLIILVANKSDIAIVEENLSAAKSFADSEDLIFVETSAKTGDGISDMFEAIVEKLCSVVKLEKLNKGGKLGQIDKIKSSTCSWCV